MSNFRFRLATVLKVREAERQQRRLELAQAFEADQVLQQQIDDLATELVLAKQQSRESATPGQVNVDRLLEFQRYGLQILARTKSLHVQQASVREEIERRRKALVEADRQVRTLEKLREKQEALHHMEVLKLEQKALDEVGARRIHKI